MLKSIDKMGVLYLMAHLIITLAFIVVYAVFAYIGQPLTTIENMLLVIVGYWFGAMGKEQMMKKQEELIEEKQKKKGA